MREYVFGVEYEAGIDRLTDAFIADPALVAKSVSIMGTGENLWRVDRISGPEGGLDRLETVFTDTTTCNECVGDHPACTAERTEYSIVSRDGTGMTVYSLDVGVENCHSVPYLAARHVGEGVLFDTLRRRNVYEWRLLVPDGSGVGTLYDALQSSLDDGISISLRGVSGATRWGEGLTTIVDMPPAQRSALEIAVGMGYYETPRGATLADVASALDLPTSTLRYRLRRAEAWVLTRLVGEYESVLGVEDGRDDAGRDVRPSE